MKGLPQIPTQSDLSRAYEALQARPGSITPPKLAEYTQYARFDPRLAEQLVDYLGKYWKRLAPGELGDAILSQPWPAAAGVILESALQLTELTAPERRRFRSWIDSVASGIAPAAGGEQYFIGLRGFAGKAMRDDAAMTHSVYAKWGYLGREVLTNKARAGRRTLVPPATRKRLLDDLIQRIKSDATSPGPLLLRARDYRDALGGWVSVRQAELDLAAHPGLRPMGNTRARVYRLL